MRILASNPDTLGDFVLRQPLYRALIDGGHELLLIVRESVLPLVPYVAPGARTLVLPYEPYANDLEENWERFGGVFEAARRFAPDVLLVAPFRWTQFEERLSIELPPAVRKIGMSGHLYAGDPYAGAARRSTLRFDAVAEVAGDQLEVEKNAALCGTVLGGPPPRVEPRLQATEADLHAGRQILGHLGLEPGGYWIACVGGTAHVAIKTWHAESWGRVLGEWARRYGRRFLFVGVPEEEPAAREALRAMAGPLGSNEAAARHAAVWMGPGGTLAQLLALTQLSAGYAGHDTGPMHVAAAMGKPVLAVQGGGTWPRFRPAVEPSVALLVGVPCVGCGWVCAFEQPYCIRAIPANAVLQAAADLEEGRIAGREARVLEPDGALQRRMIREAAAFAQQQVREKAEIAKRLQAAHREREADVNTLHEARAREAAERAAESERLRGQLQAVHDEARATREAFAAHAAETERLRQELDSRTAEAGRLAATLGERTSEVNRLRQEIRGMIEAMDRANGNGRHGSLVEPRQGPRGVLPPANETGGTGPGALSGPAGAGTPSESGEEIAQLRAAIERLEARVRELEPRIPLARRPLRQVLTDLVIGGRHYARRPQPHLPKVTVVTPVPVAADSADLEATVESVLAQDYHDLEFIVVLAAADSAATQAALETLSAYDDRIDRVLAEPGPGTADAAARGLGAAEGDVLHLLHPGDVLEPGAVRRVAEYFAHRPGVQAACSEDALLHRQGWKFPAPPQPTPDVNHLLSTAQPFRNGVFFRRWAYTALGPMKPQFGRAAEWELWVRLARRFELRRLEGHVRCIRSNPNDTHGAAYASDLADARTAFDRTFGVAGRVRCWAITLGNRVFDALRRHRLLPAGLGGRFFFPLALGPNDPPLPQGRAPAPAAGQPVSPLTDRPPDRFLFSTPDTTGGDGAASIHAPRPLHYVYFDTAADVALAYPPVALDRLEAMYAARHAGDAPRHVVRPPAGALSPYAGYRGGLLGRLGVADLLARAPSPYWWFNAPGFADTTADEILSLLRGLRDARDESVRLLNVFCFEGAVLEQLKKDTRWQTFGAETNSAAAATARAKGHTVWQVGPQDLPVALPAEMSFDVIVLADTTEHLQDPLLVLRRLRQLLTPGGLVVLNHPNLDSAHAALFGPTWGHWQVPYHRTLMGRRGLRRLAMLSDMQVLRLRTRTHPYPTCVSVQLNQLGLAAIVPDTARFPNEIASRGVRLTGWSRLLWDWRGKGDYLYAVLRLL